MASLGVTALQLMPLAECPGKRNWGYDGVLPFAVEHEYGTPDDLRHLVDEAHARGLMVILDVVCNHFGPAGNYLPRIAPEFFTDRHKTPWGDAIDWDRPVHLILENEDNQAWPLGRNDSDEVHLDNAQWNDDWHHCLHVLLLEERSGHFGDYADAPVDRLARSLAEGFVYQGEPSAHRQGAPRGTPSAHLPPTAFVNFLQNHDQVGNRALGDRIARTAPHPAVRASMALLLLAPQIPMPFMGEESGTERPFLYFCDFHAELAEAVREGRRGDFAGFPGFTTDEEIALIPDPNAEATFLASKHCWDLDAQARAWLDFTRRLLRLRTEHLVPRLRGARPGEAERFGATGVTCRWILGDGSLWQVTANLGAAPTDPAPAPTGNVILARGFGEGMDIRNPGAAPWSVLWTHSPNK